MFPSHDREEEREQKRLEAIQKQQKQQINKFFSDNIKRQEKQRQLQFKEQQRLLKDQEKKSKELTKDVDKTLALPLLQMLP